MAKYPRDDSLAPIDPFFLQLTAALVLAGITFITSASWHESIRYYGHPWNFIIKHAISVFFGLTLMFIASYSHFRWWKRFAWYCVFGVIIALLLTAKFGVVSGGSRRWLALGFLNLQSSEFAKIFAALIMTKAFVERKNRIPAFLAVIFMSLLVFKQPDLGTSIVIMSSAIAAIYASGFSLTILFGSLALILVGGIKQVLNTPYQLVRLKYWLHPNLDKLGNGYNILQSVRAIGAGGLWGAGLGCSIQKTGALPVAYADFIFAIICEEIGFLGALALLLIFFAWIMRALHISMNAQDDFGRIFGFALTIVMAVQIIINIGVATQCLPITGMTLPFISFGGSSFMSTSIIAGIIMNISRFAKLS